MKLPIMCVDKGIKANRWQCRTTQLYTVSQVLKNRLFHFSWPEGIINLLIIRNLECSTNLC